MVVAIGYFWIVVAAIGLLGSALPVVVVLLPEIPTARQQQRMQLQSEVGQSLRHEDIPEEMIDRIVNGGTTEATERQALTVSQRVAVLAAEHRISTNDEGARAAVTVLGVAITLVAVIPLFLLSMLILTLGCVLVMPRQVLRCYNCGRTLDAV